MQFMLKEPKLKVDAFPGLMQKPIKEAKQDATTFNLMKKEVPIKEQPQSTVAPSNTIQDVTVIQKKPRAPRKKKEVPSTSTEKIDMQEMHETEDNIDTAPPATKARRLKGAPRKLL